MERTNLKEAVNIAGSVASITGVSLLWFKDLSPHSSLAFAVPIYLVASLLGMGVVAAVFLVFNFGYEFFLGGTTIPAQTPTTAGKLAYMGLAGGVLLIFTAIALATIFHLAWELVEAAPQMFGLQ